MIGVGYILKRYTWAAERVQQPHHFIGVFFGSSTRFMLTSDAFEKLWDINSSRHWTTGIVGLGGLGLVGFEAVRIGGGLLATGSFGLCSAGICWGLPVSWYFESVQRYCRVRRIWIIWINLGCGQPSRATASNLPTKLCPWSAGELHHDL